MMICQRPTQWARKLPLPLFSLSAVLAVGFSASVGADAQAAAATETTLLPFNGSQGLNPLSPVVVDSAGAIYGTSAEGGDQFFTPINGFGVVYKLTPPAPPDFRWTETNLFSFDFTAAESTGIFPTGTVAVRDGLVVGTTGGGGSANAGTIFLLGPPANPDGTLTETVLHSFQGGPDGVGPGGIVARAQGPMFGMTEEGGDAACNCGVVFQLSPPATPGGAWTEAVIYRFLGGADGATPSGNVIVQPDGVLFGTTTRGGDAQCNCGTAFTLTPPARLGGDWTETVIYRFRGQEDGANPNAPILVQGALYGTTFRGPSTPAGAVFRLTPPLTLFGPWREETLHNFAADGSEGTNPVGSLAAAPFDPVIRLFGATSLGGLATEQCFGEGCGTVFELAPPLLPGADWRETTLHEFTGDVDGGLPGNGVILDRTGAILGTTEAGGGVSCLAEFFGDVGCGTVYEVIPPR